MNISILHPKTWTLLALLSLGGCDSPEDTEEAAETEERSDTADRVVLSGDDHEALGIVTVLAEARELRPSLEVSAELLPDPDRHAEIGPTVDGRVVSVSARPGDEIKQGAVVVVLESPEVGSARADLLTARARRVAATARWERERDLLADHATSTQEFQGAEADKLAAEAELGAARARLAALGAPVGEGAEVSTSSRLSLRSPVGGTVVAREAHLGQSVALGDTLIEVVDLDSIWLVANVYEREMRFLDEGQDVQVEVRAYPGVVFEGLVDQVGGALDDRNRTIPVRVVLDNADHRLLPGMFATARILGTLAHEAQPMLAVPWSAVQEIDGHSSIFVKEGDAYQLRRVHTGERAGGQVEVLNGLNEGDEVVTEGAFLLKGELLKSSLGEDE